MGWVVDASVAMAWYVELPYSPAASPLLEGGDLLIAPELVLTECANAAWKMARGGHIQWDHARFLVRSLSQTFDELYSLAPLMERAVDLARELDHPVYDMVYVGLAEESGFSLATADKALYRKVGDSGLGVDVALVAVARDA